MAIDQPNPLVEAFAVLARLPHRAKPTQLTMFPLVSLHRMPLDRANILLGQWGHRLGPIHRPFHVEAYGLEVAETPVSVAVSASTVSTTVACYHRQEVVECARLCSDPANPWATRVMLRLWREVCAQQWPCWTVRAAVSYAQNAHHSGNLYRFDGWQKVSDHTGSSGGGTWTKRRNAGDAVSGTKTLWLWRYDRDAG